MYAFFITIFTIFVGVESGNHSVLTNPHLTAFRSVGTLRDGVAHAHLILTFNLTQEREVVEELRREIVAVTRNTSTRLWSPTLHLLAPLEEDWESLLTILHTTSPAMKRRSKRQAVLVGLAAGAVVVSAGLGIYNAQETHLLNERLSESEKQVNKLFSMFHSSVKLEKKMIDNVSALKLAVSAIENSIGELEEFMTVSEAAHALLHRLQRRHRGFEQVTGHKLDPQLMEESELRHCFDKLADQVDRAGYRMVYDNINQLYQEDVSYTIEKDILTVFVHVPVIAADRDRTLELFEHVALPIVGVNQSAPFLVSPSGSTTFLAVDVGKELFIELTPEDLQACGRTGSDFGCSFVFPRLRGGETACLPALFLHHTASANKWCERRSFKEEEKIFRVNSTAFVFWTREERTINIECGSKLTAQSVQGLLLINIEAGCTLNAEHVVFHSEEGHLPDDLHVVIAAPSIDGVVAAENEVNRTWPQQPDLKDLVSAEDALEGELTAAEQERGIYLSGTHSALLTGAFVGVMFLVLAAVATIWCWMKKQGLIKKMQIRRVREETPVPMEIDEECAKMLGESDEEVSPQKQIVLELV